jgi:signal transduction histidine kinase
LIPQEIAMTWPASISARTTAFAGPAQGPRRFANRMSSFRSPLPVRVSIVHLAVVAHLAGVLWLALDAPGGAAARYAPSLLLVTGLALCLAFLLQQRSSGRFESAQGRPDGRTVPVTFSTPLPASHVAGRPADGWSDLLQRVSHELRTPLNAVIGFSDVMHKELLGPLGHARYVEYADHIRQSGGDLLKATEDTLAITALLSRAEQIELTELEFASLMRDVRLAALARFPGRDVDVTLTVDRDIEVVGDRRILRQALLNALCVVMRNAERGCQVEIVARQAGDTVWLTIEASAASGAGEDALEACLARALFSVCGQDLRLSGSADKAFSARVGLPAAAQRDLFMPSGATAAAYRND